MKTVEITMLRNIYVSVDMKPDAVKVLDKQDQEIPQNGNYVVTVSGEGEIGRVRIFPIAGGVLESSTD